MLNVTIMVTFTRTILIDIYIFHEVNCILDEAPLDIGKSFEYASEMNSKKRKKLYGVSKDSASWKKVHSGRV